MERTIRKQKQDIKLLEKGGADKDDLTAARCRKRLTEKTYTEFSAAMGLRQQRERLKVGEANPTKGELEAIENRKRIAIIKSELKELGFRGKINLEPSKVDFEKLSFDGEHINNERQHEVTLMKQRILFAGHHFRRSSGRDSSNGITVKMELHM